MSGHSRELHSSLVAELAAALAADLETTKPRGSWPRHRGIPSFAPDAPVVYTAFDGDHFGLVSLMRRYVLRHGGVPLNPESVVGYKDAIDAYHQKEGVLRADLALVAKSSEIWIFTDLAPGDLNGLPEGVASELLFYLMHCPQPIVRYVRLMDLFSEAPDGPSSFDVALQAMQGELIRGRPELLRFVESVVPADLPPVAFCLYDPLDSKYAHWIRSDSHRRGYVSVAPTLAIELGDAGESMAALEQVLTSWAILLRICDLSWTWPSIDERGLSRLQDMLGQLAREAGHTIQPREWADLYVPKALDGVGWPITHRESAHQHQRTA